MDNLILHEKEIRTSIELYERFKKNTMRNEWRDAFYMLHQGRICEYLKWDQSKLSRICNGIVEPNDQDKELLRKLSIKLKLAQIMLQSIKLKGDIDNEKWN